MRRLLHRIWRSRPSKHDESAFPGGGFTDRNGQWRTDHRTVGEYHRDSILFLLALFAAPWLVLGLVVAAAWLA